MIIIRVNFLDLKKQYAGIKDDIQKEINDVLENNWYVLGPKVQEFEKNFAAFCNTKYCVGVGNGTAALTLAFRALDLKPGDEVIVPVNTFFATAEAASEIGIKPVFVDINADDYAIDTVKIESVITKNTRAIIPVHLYGQCADMDNIISIAKKHNLHVIEDAAQAHGAKYKGKPAGSMGIIGCFSFYPGKNLGAYGEGGACITNDAALAEKIKMLRDHGSKEKYYHLMIGYNSRLEGIQGAVLNVKLKHLDKWNDARRRNAKIYDFLLNGIPQTIVPFVHYHNEHVYHLYVIQAESRDELQQFLKDNEIFTGLHYPISLHLQEAYKNLGYKEGDFPTAEAYVKKILSLPMYAEIQKDEIEHVCSLIKKFYSMR